MPVQQSIGIYKLEGKKRRWITMQYQALSSPDADEAYVFIANRGSGCEHIMEWESFKAMLQTEGKTHLLKAAEAKLAEAKVVTSRGNRRNLTKAELLKQLRHALGEV